MLVSAIMLTRGRPQFAREAVNDFLAQTWAESELVILDDADDPSFDDPIYAAGIFYHRVDLRMLIGEKRNAAITLSHGDVIVHWDDDDRYAPDRIEHQVELLSSDLDMVAYSSMEFVDEDDGSRYFRKPGAPIGVSFCYWRRTWEERPFAIRQIGEDNEFRNGRRMRLVPANGRIVARIHHGNTSEKRIPIAANPEQWERIS